MGNWVLGLIIELEIQIVATFNVNNTQTNRSLCVFKAHLSSILVWSTQGLVKGAILCFRNPYFYFRHGESTSTASQLTSLASQKSKDLNKVSLLLQDLEYTTTHEF